MPSFLQTWALPVAVIAIANIAATWYRLVLEHVPDPYLDEVFHVPQAQRYCKNDYSWDPKITTPPGLYLTSLLLELILGCDTHSLRLLNVGAICMICLTAYEILRYLRPPSPPIQAASGDQEEARGRSSNADQTYLLDAHSALNISLFPPLFFFSGLYYTDVASTLVVLLNYSAFLKRGRGNWKARDEIVSGLLAITALSFRQTNIFWVAIFPAGLAIIDALKRNGTFATNAVKMKPTEILTRSWKEGRIYDIRVLDATFQDYILISVSIILAAMKAPLNLVKAILPYITLLGIFAGFVAWNGGVVLGDKSNHVATIHTPQMLYFWPYIVFFSFPLLLPLFLAPFIRLLPNSRLKSFCQDNLVGRSETSTPGITSIIAFLLSGLVAVHWNTIVHPFTQADNRHYVFYVFRILLRHPAIKYAAVPFYYICAWMVIQTLGSGLQGEVKSEQKTKQARLLANGPVHQPCQASFILVFLATTSLSVVSAPLVEPRYFIIPWAVWRLHAPTTSASPSPRSIGKVSYDMRLALETAWHLAINAITGYIFLYNGFLWPSEPEKIQRFLY